MVRSFFKKGGIKKFNAKPGCMFLLLDPVREGTDNLLGERGGVASCSGGAEVSVQQEREREREINSAMFVKD